MILSLFTLALLHKVVHQHTRHFHRLARHFNGGNVDRYFDVRRTWELVRTGDILIAVYGIDLGFLSEGKEYPQITQIIHWKEEPRMVAPTHVPQQTGAKHRGNENEIKVFISHRDSKCGECGEQLGRQAWITLEENKGALCLACADLEQLVFLPTGDAALTRRSKKYSTLSAVVLKFSRARRRYERQGLLVEEAALAQAEAECLADSEVRERRNERARERRAEQDEEYVRQFAKRVKELFPKSPEGREQAIAEHACLKYSGRVGRSAGAKSFEEELVRLAVMAHVRHRETNYDSLLANGWDRSDARAQVRDRVDAILEKWRG